MSYQKCRILITIMTFVMIFFISQIAFSQSIPVDIDVELAENLQNAQMFFLSDFNVDKISESAPTFSITLRNTTNVEQTVILHFNMFSGDGQLFTQEVILKPIKLLPNESLTMSNQNWGSGRFAFQVKPELNLNFVNLINSILTSGRLPSNTYEFVFTLYDANNNLLKEVRKSFQITNPSTIDLFEPEGVVYTLYPQFIWQSDMSEFTIKIYELYPENSSVQDATNNVPILEEKLGDKKTFVYPSSGKRQLEYGKTYVWLVDGSIPTSGTPYSVRSEIKTFQPTNLSPNTANQEINDILQNILGTNKFDALKKSQLANFNPTTKIRLDGKTITVNELRMLADKVQKGEIKVKQFKVE